MGLADTKTTILDAAEALFAEVGFTAATLRQLTARAHVNLAAVHYHFGSKDELAVAVLVRRLGPINAERRRRLALLPPAPPVEQVVRAFVEPVFGADGPLAAGAPLAPARDFCRLMGRVLVEQPLFLRPLLTAQFRDLARRFAAVLATALPQLEPTTVWWRLHFLVGAMAHTLQNAGMLAQLGGDACRADDPRSVVDQLVAFASAGLAAPAAAVAPATDAPARRPRARRPHERAAPARRGRR